VKWRKTNVMAKDNLFYQMEQYMKEIGRITKGMA